MIHRKMIHYEMNHLAMVRYLMIRKKTFHIAERGCEMSFFM